MSATCFDRHCHLRSLTLLAIALLVGCNEPVEPDSRIAEITVTRDTPTDAVRSLIDVMEMQLELHPPTTHPNYAALIDRYLDVVDKEGFDTSYREAVARNTPGAAANASTRAVVADYVIGWPASIGLYRDEIAQAFAKAQVIVKPPSRMTGSVPETSVLIPVATTSDESRPRRYLAFMCRQRDDGWRVAALSWLASRAADADADVYVEPQ